MQKVAALFVVLAVSAGVGACGGDDSEEADDSGADDFPTLANEICNEGAAEAAQVYLELGYSADEEDMIELREQIRAIRAEALAQLEELEPPAELAEAFDKSLATRQLVIDAMEDEIAAREEGNTAGAEKAAAKAAEAADVINESSEEAGLSDCAGVLPDDDAQAAEDVLREFATTADPATSCSSEGEGLLTEIYLEEGFGGVEACTKEQKDIEEDLATDVKVSHASGVDDVVAVLEYEDVGGRFDKVPTTSTLYYVDGAWRIYTIEETSG
ncbi:MAG: hypothetical protein QOI31_2086 [Solirubrobacterales bacterium]|nr:hypothetical protein [Solirubrobacterales bacterium]